MSKRWSKTCEACGETISRSRPHPKLLAAFHLAPNGTACVTWPEGLSPNQRAAVLEDYRETLDKWLANPMLPLK